MNFDAGTNVSHYRIVSKIGKGGMGDVYLADDTKLDRQVALKILPVEFAEDKDRMGRFVREAKSASALNHPNIITIHEIGEFEGTHYIATEFIDGQTLSEYANENPLNLESALDIAIQTASALDVAHSAGIVHRDIKPDNVMIRPDGLAKILDFGIAKLSEPPAVAGGRPDEAATLRHGKEDKTLISASPRPPIPPSQMTTPGMIIGTANYMSPEQARGIDVDHQTDIFSFGVVFYEMLSGTSPFAAGTLSDTLAAVLMKDPKPIESIPAKLSTIVSKTLQKVKNERYQTAKDLLDDLKEFKLEAEIQSHLERTSSPDLKDQNTQILNVQKTIKSKGKNSIVVLPFQNIGGDAEDEYFSDGLTDEIISDLSNIRSMRVISRNSAMSLKGTAKDIKTITQELDVRYVLDGSVRKAGQDLRISVQLIDGATDANLWAEKYSGSIDDIFDIQESVSRSIAGALQITLTTGEIEQIEERPIADSRAYDLYLQAKANFNQIVPETLNRSIELLKQGLEIIGENELLYAALGYTYYSYFRWISKLDENYLRLANECLEKTFALNPVSSHGFVLKGLLSYSHGQMPEAIESLTKAVESDPTNVEALFWLVVNLNYIGKGEEAKHYIDRIISIDPLTPMNIFLGGFVPVYTGEFAESLPFVERAIAIDESSSLLIWSAVVIKAWCGKTEEAIKDAEKLAGIAPGWVYTEHALFLKHALLGEKELALQHYTPDFDKEAQYDCHFALHVAHCFALINEKEKALDFLEIAVQTGMVNHPFLSRLDPLLENIRGEQRFKDLMQEAKRLSGEINFVQTVKQAESLNVEEANTQIFQQPTTTEKRAGSTTDSGEGFRVTVLPFKYSGSDDEIATLAEGLSEDMITGLSKFSYLRVIAQGQKHGAEYIIEGNIRQVGATLRIAAKLVNIHSGQHLWAETYERSYEPKNIFLLQDELVPVIVSSVADLHGVLPHAISESLRTRDPDSLSTYEAVLRTFGYIERITEEEHAEVRNILERTAAKDPENADCQAMLSYIYAEEYKHGFNIKPNPLGRALDAARRASTSAPSNHLAHHMLAQAHFFRREIESFKINAERAVELNPMDSDTIAFMGILLTYAGEWERGCTLAEKAMRLNPHHPGWYRFAAFNNAFRNGDFKAALDVARNFNMPSYFYTHIARAAVNGHIGNLEEARDAIEDLLRLKPDFESSALGEMEKWFVDPDLLKKYCEGLEIAGFQIEGWNSDRRRKRDINALVGNDSAPHPIDSNSIAVMPFTNMSADEENEYFCDGLAEELLNALSKIEDLKVAARTSAFSFKGKDANVSEIGEKLSVKNVLEGSVRKSGNKVRISVRLENAADGYQLWAESYDREMEDIFDVQDEIALAVVDALKVELFGDEKAAVLKRGTNNPKAYQLYLKGRFYFEKFTVEGYEKSVDYFKQALAMEPNYAPAFAALSKSYNFACYLGFGKTAKCFSEAKAAVDRALALDQTLAEAQHSLALIKFNYERDWISAEKAFRRAIELNYSENHEHYCMFLAVLERSDEAVAEGKLTIELAPLALVPNYIAGWGFWLAGRVDLAHEQGEKLLEMEANFSGGHILRGMSLWEEGSYQKAISNLETAVNLGGGNDIKMLLGLMYGMEGEQVKANQLLTDFERLEERGIFTAIQQAFIYAGSGEMDRAFEFLAKASERHEGSLPFLKQFSSICPEFHNDPRMTDLLNRLGLPTDKTNQTDESPEANTVLLKSEPTAKDLETKTAEIESTSEPTTNQKSKTQNPKPKWWLFGFLGLIVLVGGFFGYNYFVSDSTQINSIAVLPFENMSSDADSDYLSDGLAESLIYRLSQLPNLKVSPTSSVFRYKGKQTDPNIVAQELGVDSVLTGRITQRGDDLNISVELIDVRKNKLIWGEKYQRKLSELLATQRQIATEISQNLKLKLSGNEKGLTKPYTDSNEAYQLYLKGRYHFAKRTKDDMLKSIEYFRQAIKLDPDFALAYARIADVYNQMPAYPFISSHEAFPKAKAAAEKALEIDPSLSEAHTALANALAVYDWNWAEAEREFKRAIELNPNSADAHFRYAQVFLSSTGRHDESIREMNRALELEPLDLTMSAIFSQTLRFSRQNNRAIEQAKKTLDLEPEFVLGVYVLGQALIIEGKYQEAIDINEKVLSKNPNRQLILENVGYAYAKSGRRKEAEEIIAKFREIAKTDFISTYYTAIIYAALGDKDKAFAELQTAAENKDWSMQQMNVDPLMDPLRGDPRFKDLVERLGLPE